MSKTLDDLLERARMTRIVDGEEMDRITEKMLSLPYAEIVSSEAGYKDTVCALISEGFDLDRDKVKSCSLREIITLISYEPGVSSFRCKDVGLSPGNRKTLSCACSCVGLVQELQQARYLNPYVQQFLSIDFSEYVSHIIQMLRLGGMDVWYGKKRYSDDMDRRAAGEVLDHFYLYKDYMMKHYQIDVGRGDARTTLRVMQDLTRKARKNWLCGSESFEEYREMVQEASQIITEFFMVVMRTAYVRNDRADFKEIVKKCSKAPDRDLNFIEYRDCYEIRGVTECQHKKYIV